MKTALWIIVIILGLPLAFCVYSYEQSHKRAAVRPIQHDNVPSFHVADVSRIVADSRDNEARFRRDFAGRRFDDVVPFLSISTAS